MTAHSRLFVLEQGVSRPLDYALSEGSHELRDCGVRLRLDGSEVILSWLGTGPAAFVLPGARQLRIGQWLTVEEGARVSWAGRDWIFVAHALAGDDAAPPRGICLNANGTGFPANALMLVVGGKDRGNFYRCRSEAFEPSPGVTLRSVRSDDAADGDAPTLGVSARVPEGLVLVDDEPVAPDTTLRLAADQTLTIAATTDNPAMTLQVVLA